LHIPFHQITPKTNHILLRNLLHKLPDVHPSRALHRNQCPLPVREYLCACVCVPISEICFVSSIKTFSAFSRDTAHAVLLSSHTHTQIRGKHGCKHALGCRCVLIMYRNMRVCMYTNTLTRTHARTHSHTHDARTHTHTHTRSIPRTHTYDTWGRLGQPGDDMIRRKKVVFAHHIPLR